MYMSREKASVTAIISRTAIINGLLDSCFEKGYTVSLTINRGYYTTCTYLVKNSRNEFIKEGFAELDDEKSYKSAKADLEDLVLRR